MIGSTIAHYKVTAKLGAGGMGEVYRAMDTKLGREVALKVLPEAFAADAQRMQRFQREAQVLASLNHPHIAAIYGLEEVPAGTAPFDSAQGRSSSSRGVVRALVMELVEGPTLAEHIAGGVIPIEEALAVAKQIAEALEYAHEKGIIHRDLKPANIKRTPDGQVKVLDFGLAKALADDPGSGTDLSNSPTLSLAATKAGIILGTAAYMPPEQAKGKAVDRRADIWSFGCVLYEMLTGKRAYPGEDVSETLAAVIRGEPDWNALPRELPHFMRHLLRRCLEKDMKRRLQAIGEARLAIEDALTRPEAGEDVAAEPGKLKTVLTPLWWRALAWVVASLTTAIAVAAIWVAWRNTQQVTPPVARFAIPVPVDANLKRSSQPMIAISPDGTRIVFSAIASNNQPQLYLRALDRLEAVAIPGTEGAFEPFFSPDGQWVAFLSSAGLKKVAIAGGGSVTISNVPDVAHGGFWALDDVIYFTLNRNSGLRRVAVAGGTPETVTTIDSAKNERVHHWAQVLPGGEAVLFEVGIGNDIANSRIVARSLRDGTQHTLVEGASFPRYLRTGQLLFVRGDTLFAAPFDASRLQLAGPALPVLEKVATHKSSGAAQVAVSENGTLVYLAGGLEAEARIPVWVSRSGKEEVIALPQRAFVAPSISPDGRRLAVTVQGQDQDVWIFEFGRGALTRLTFEAGNDMSPLWTPDGKRITFAATRLGLPNLYWQPADGSGTSELLLKTGNPKFPTSWLPDGKTLLYQEVDPVNKWDLWTLPVVDGKPGTPRVFLATPYGEAKAMISPDSRWVAYESNETGREEIYVRPFPGPGGKVQVSTEGGSDPRWARNGRELFYRAADKFIVVAVKPGREFLPEKPRTFFAGSFAPGGGVEANYDVAPDGRFLLLKLSNTSGAQSRQFSVILNWFEELKRSATGGKP